MPRLVILDAHEWTNEVPTVPGQIPVKPQPRERAWKIQRGKKTLLSLTLDSLCGMISEVKRRWEEFIPSMGHHHFEYHSAYSIIY